MKYKVGFVSLGCPKNLTDTETMIGLLKNDYQLETNPQKADIIIVNTCGFIESAKQESIDTIIEMGEYKNSGRLKKLIVTGCLAQRYSREILEQLPEVDAVVGSASFIDIKTVLSEVTCGEKRIFMRDINETVPENLPRVLSTPKYSAYLKIADGCNNKCTYCVIPQIRGKYRSRKIEDIVAEATRLAQGGVREVILIAQDTTYYGVDLYKKKMIAPLLKELAKIEKLRWIRVHYCYPEMIDDELIETFKNTEKICPYIDIPFQHASDAVLKNMARRSSFEKNCRLIEKLRENVKDIYIRSSFIVGFPGETEQDFEVLKEFIKFARLDRLGVFTYSAEEGTVAAEMDGQIDSDLKEQRREEIMEIQKQISKEKCGEKIGTVIEVLCEGECGKNLFQGRSRGDSPEIDGKVVFNSKEKICPGDFVKVKIKKAYNYDLEGDFVEYC